jgi:hypothetical protein
LGLLFLKKKLESHAKNELLWLAWHHNCCRNMNNRHNYLFQPIEILDTSPHVAAQIQPSVLQPHVSVAAAVHVRVARGAGAAPQSASTDFDLSEVNEPHVTAAVG